MSKAKAPRGIPVRRVPGLLALLTMLALAVFFAGCSRSVPQPVSPVQYTQERVQAADHWRNVAEETAKYVAHTLEERRDILTRPIFIQPPNGRPFSVALHDLLKSEMVSRAMQVAEKREAGGLCLEYDVQTVVHDSSRGGAWLAGQQEIVVNMRMALDNRYVMHRSYLYYINEADWPLYAGPESQDPDAGRTKTLRVIKR